jgi:hypothetical protein
MDTADKSMGSAVPVSSAKASAGGASTGAAATPERRTPSKASLRLTLTTRQAYTVFHSLVLLDCVNLEKMGCMELENRRSVPSRLALAESCCCCCQSPCPESQGRRRGREACGAEGGGAGHGSHGARRCWVLVASRVDCPGYFVSAVCVCMATGRRAPDNPVAAGAGLDIQRRWPLLVEVDIPTEQSRD